MGVLFALAFCPYSGALYFGILIPMTISANGGIHLPFVFAIGTGIPVMIMAYLLAFSISRLSNAFNKVQKLEKYLRTFTGVLFVITGIYIFMIYMSWI